MCLVTRRRRTSRPAHLHFAALISLLLDHSALACLERLTRSNFSRSRSKHGSWSLRFTVSPAGQEWTTALMQSEVLHCGKMLVEGSLAAPCCPEGGHPNNGYACLHFMRTATSTINYT